MNDNRIRVAFFADILIDGFDGAVRTMFQLINRIDDGQFEFLFFTGSGPDKLLGFECVKIPSLTLPINATYSMALPVLAQNRINQKIQAFRPDVIHIATPSPLGHYALKMARQHDLPVLTIYHTHFISYTDHYLKHLPFLIKGVKQLITDGYRAFYNDCDLVYVPSASMCAELVDMGITPDNFKIWKRGLDTDLFNPEKCNRTMMRELTGNDRPVVLFASRLVWEKNLETLIRIYEQMQLQCPDVNFVIVGDGVARAECEAAMPKAIFTGKVDHEQLSVLYSSADVFVFPSVSETYGNVVQEAMASGLPCVIANGGGSADLIQNDINGYKCDPYNEGCYVEKILMLLNNDQLRQRLVGNALLLSTQACWQKLAHEYFEDLKALTQTHLAITA